MAGNTAGEGREGEEGGFYLLLFKKVLGRFQEYGCLKLGNDLYKCLTFI